MSGIFTSLLGQEMMTLWQSGAIPFLNRHCRGSSARNWNLCLWHSMATPPKPFDRFDLDLARAVLEQLIERFESLDVGPLDTTTINQVFPEQGVHQLFQNTKLVYAGKTSKSLPRRLLRHLRLLSGRKNITLSELGFKAVIIHRNWIPSVHEGMVIQHYTQQG